MQLWQVKVYIISDFLLAFKRSFVASRWWLASPMSMYILYCLWPSVTVTTMTLHVQAQEFQKIINIHLGVSKNRVFPPNHPISSHFNRVFHYEPSILGYPHPFGTLALRKRDTVQSKVIQPSNFIVENPSVWKNAGEEFDNGQQQKTRLANFWRKNAIRLKLVEMTCLVLQETKIETLVFWCAKRLSGWNIPFKWKNCFDSSKFIENSLTSDFDFVQSLMAISEKPIGRLKGSFWRRLAQGPDNLDLSDGKVAQTPALFGWKEKGFRKQNPDPTHQPADPGRRWRHATDGRRSTQCGDDDLSCKPIKCSVNCAGAIPLGASAALIKAALAPLNGMQLSDSLKGLPNIVEAVRSTLLGSCLARIVHARDILRRLHKECLKFSTLKVTILPILDQ